MRLISYEIRGEIYVITDNPEEEIRRQVAEFERHTGRVPTIEELAKILEIDPRLLARRLKKFSHIVGSGRPN